MHIKSIDIDITERCNLACPYCYHKKKTNKDMSYKVLNGILRLINLNNKTPMNIIFMGGEPLLAIDKIEYIVARAENCKFQVVSNITLLTKEIAKWLKKNKISLHCSIDGPSYIQNKQRPLKNINNISSSELIEQNIELAKYVSPNDYIRMTLAPENVSSYYDNIKYVLGKLNYNSCYVSVIPEKLDYKILDSEMAKAANFCLENNKTIKWATSNNNNKYYCNAGIHKIAISTEGKIYPCHRFSGAGVYMLGYLDDFFIQASVDLHKSKCIDCSICAGGCPFINFMYGTIKKYGYSPPKAFCKIKRLEFKWANYIKDSQK